MTSVTYGSLSHDAVDVMFASEIVRNHPQDTDLKTVTLSRLKLYIILALHTTKHTCEKWALNEPIGGKRVVQTRKVFRKLIRYKLLIYHKYNTDIRT